MNVSTDALESAVTNLEGAIANAAQRNQQKASGSAQREADAQAKLNLIADRINATATAVNSLDADISASVTIPRPAVPSFPR